MLAGSRRAETVACLTNCPFLTPQLNVAYRGGISGQLSRIGARSCLGSGVLEGRFANHPKFASVREISHEDAKIAGRKMQLP
jgi:hypothetical protein